MSEKRASRLGLYLPLGLAVVLFVGYAIAWFSAAGEVKRQIESWAEEERAAGREVAFESIKSKGFPIFLRVEIAEPYYADPEADWSWTAPLLAFHATPFNPRHVVALPSGAQEIVRNGETWRVEAETARGSFREASASRRMVVELANGRAVNETAGALVSAVAFDRLVFESSETDAPENDAAPAATRLFADGVTFETPTLLTAKVEARLDRLELSAAFDPGPPGTALWENEGGAADIDRLRIIAGDFRLDAVGAFDVGADGLPSGALTAQIENATSIVQLAAAAGEVKEDEAIAMDMALTLLAAATGDGQTINADIRVKRGEISLGPLKLGQLAPLF